MTPRKIVIGPVVYTTGAMRAITAAKVEGWTYVLRHEAGDWGNLCAEDVASNDRTAPEGYALSSYTLPTGTVIWVQTDPQAFDFGINLTTVYLPEEH